MPLPIAILILALIILWLAKGLWDGRDRGDIWKE